MTRLPHFFKGFPQFEAAGRRRMFGVDEGDAPPAPATAQPMMLMTERTKALLTALLEPCPTRRPTAKQALVQWHGTAAHV